MPAEQTIPLLAQKIRAARQGTGLSQKKFAQRVGEYLPDEIRKPTRFDMMRWEKGDEPRLRMLEAIAKASGKDLDFFTSAEDGEFRQRARELVAPFQRGDGRRPTGRVPAKSRRKRRG